MPIRDSTDILVIGFVRKIRGKDMFFDNSSCVTESQTLILNMSEKKICGQYKTNLWVRFEYQMFSSMLSA